MIQIIPELLTFDQFIDWHPENSEHHYELHNGEIVEIPKATGKHSKLADFTPLKVGIEIERLNLPYFTPKECVLKPISEESGYEPDIIRPLAKVLLIKLWNGLSGPFHKEKCFLWDGPKSPS